MYLLRIQVILARKQKAAKEDLKEQEPFLAEIRENPDDPAGYAVFADWLEEKGDPRGEFMNIQLQLEDEKLKTPARKKLQEQEKSLLKKHQREWLGDLAPFLIDQQGKDTISYQRGPVYSFEFQRGFPAYIKVRFLLPDFCKVLKRSPLSDEMTRLHIGHIPDGDELSDEFELDAESWSENRCFDALSGCTFARLRHFEVSRDDGQSYAEGSGVHRLISRMPQLESLHLEARNVDAGAVFKARLPNLKSLNIHHLRDYPMQLLARNKSLAQLKTLSCHPHALDDDDEPYIQLNDLKAICRAKQLTSLENLSLYCTTVGDEGIDELLKSGLLARLTTLDLSNGCITDSGAEQLLNAALTKLNSMGLNSNYISPGMVKKLKAAYGSVQSSHQYTGNPRDDDDFPEYLYMGDME